jgi:hypothetical protein
MLTCLLAAGCHQLTSDLPAPCDTLTLMQVREECRQQVRAECARDANDKVDEKCPRLIACHERIQKWHQCSNVGSR